MDSIFIVFGMHINTSGGMSAKDTLGAFSTCEAAREFISFYKAQLLTPESTGVLQSYSFYELEEHVINPHYTGE